VLSINSESRLDWSLSFHLIFNAGKRSVTLDFTDEAGKEKLWAVLRDFGPDVLVHNYRHLDLARSIGVGPEQVRERFPGITYTHVNAYGNHGVWKDRPGFEQVVQAVSGIQVGYARGGRPTLLPSPVIDIGCGLLGAFGSLLGLYRRRRTGVGAAVTTHLTSVAVLLQLPQVAAHQRPGCLARAQAAGATVGFDPSREVLSGILLARGESVCVSGPRGDLARWLAFLGQPGWADRVAASIGERVGRRAADEAPELAALRVTLASRPLAQWRRLLDAAGLSDRIGLVTQAPLGHIVEDLATMYRRLIPLVRRRVHPGTPQPLAYVASPLTLSATPLADVEPTPLRGTDTRAVLARVGVDVPDGTGVVPYPTELPLWKHAVTVVRWGYFAWRSGNI
jgi:crotonobetainyl-CoA:carnitine CoA-transferase CaiB-like acyl-CoA transferase